MYVCSTQRRPAGGKHRSMPCSCPDTDSIILELYSRRLHDCAQEVRICGQTSLVPSSYFGNLSLVILPCLLPDPQKLLPPLTAWNLSILSNSASDLERLLVSTLASGSNPSFSSSRAPSPTRNQDPRNSHGSGVEAKHDVPF